MKKNSSVLYRAYCFWLVDQALQQSAKLDLKKVVVGASSLGLFDFPVSLAWREILKVSGGLEGNYETLGEILVAQFHTIQIC
jgi:hypothetical protein